MDDSGSIEEAVQRRVEEENLARTEKKQGEASAPDADASRSKFVLDCLHAIEMGDGVLFSDLHQGQFVFNKSSTEWLAWSGHHWEMDLTNSALSSVESVAQAYAEEVAKMAGKVNWALKKGDEMAEDRFRALQKSFQKRVDKLRTERGRQNCLRFAHTNAVHALYVLGDQIDQEPWLLACSNGVIDLRTGEMRPGRPEDYLMRASPVEWQGIDAPAPTWDQTLDAIFEDREMILYLQRLFGYAITGLTVEPILPVLFGQGRNGKTTIVETIGHVLGPLAGPIPSEMLLDSGRFTNASAPTPELMDLRGLRIAFGSEIEENRRFSSSRVKWLSGSDTIIGRAPHDKYSTKFQPTHTLILMSNHEPDAPMSDAAFWARIHLIPFSFSFVDRAPEAEHERPADKYLSEKLKSEASGILAWVARGCLRWQDQGICPPEKVRVATEDYRRSEDLLADFLEACCTEDPAFRESAAALYDAFKTWWVDNVSKKVLSQKKFGRLLGRRFKRVKSNTVQYLGLRLLRV